MGTTNSVANTRGRVAAIILAAGGSTRLGRPKQLVLVEGEPLLRRTVRLVLEAAPSQVLVVLGCQSDIISEVVRDLPISLLTNEDWASGMASSVRCGVTAARAKGSSAALILPCDLPRLSTSHLSALIETYREGIPLVGTSWRNKEGELASGAPALWDQSYFPQLLALQGDEGARNLLRAHRDVLRTVEFQGAAVDVDTPEDLQDLGS